MSLSYGITIALTASVAAFEAIETLSKLKQIYNGGKIYWPGGQSSDEGRCKRKEPDAGSKLGPFAGRRRSPPSTGDVPSGFRGQFFAP